MVGAPVHQAAGNRADVGLLIRRAPAQDVEDHDQELAGDGHDRRLASADAIGQALELGLPVIVGLYSFPGGFHHRRSQLAAALLGNTATAVGGAGGPRARAHSTVADQVLGTGKTLDLSDGRQDRHGVDPADARQLDQERGLVGPGDTDAQGCQLGFDLADHGRAQLDDLKSVRG